MTSDSRSGVVGGGGGVGFKPSLFHHLIFSDKKLFLHYTPPTPSRPPPQHTHRSFFVLSRNILVGNAVMD